MHDATLELISLYKELESHDALGRGPIDLQYSSYQKTVSKGGTNEGGRRHRGKRDKSGVPSLASASGGGGANERGVGVSLSLDNSSRDAMELSSKSGETKAG